MKTFKLFSMAALALVMAACSSDDNVLETATPTEAGKMHFTATIAAPNSGATTRTTYTEDGTTINVAWKVNDQIALVHNGVVDKATVKTVNSDGSATIEADEFTGSPSDNDDVYLAYPAEAVASATPYESFPFTPSSTCFNKVMTQEGTLAFIQNNLDFRMGQGQLAVSGTDASLKGSVSFSSLICIWKLTLQDESSTALNATKVSVKYGGYPQAVGLSTTGKSEYYLCVVPSNLPGGDLTIEATVGSDTYTYTKAGGAALSAGKYYQSTVKMTKPAEGHALSASAVGEIVGTDGKAYAVADKDNLPSGVTAVAMVAYKDDASGLAISLADESNGDCMVWADAKSTCEGKAKVGSYSWRLPSRDEWGAMFKAFGGDDLKYSGLNDALATAGGNGSKLQKSTYYWSSTDYYDEEDEEVDVWDVGLYLPTVVWSASEMDDEDSVRACFAF